MTSARDEAAGLSGAYALNAVSAEERTQFETHLAQSEETRNEVTELTDTAVLLGLATDPIDPPPALRASIMAALATTPQLPHEAEPREAESEAVLPSSGAAESRARTRWFTRPVAALAAAAAAIILIVGGGLVANSLSNNSFQQAQANQLAAINAAADSQRVVSAIEGGGTATLVWSQGLKSSALLVDGLKALPADRVYELWYIDSTGARPAGTFTVGGTGGTWRVLDGRMARGDTVGITVEPRGGSPAPTTAPIVAIASA